jgi:hypothetical protein
VLHLCTYFDRNYLVRGLSLFRSLRDRVENFRLYVLCLDEATYAAITALEEERLCPVRLQTLELHDAELLSIKPARSRIEYYFTCSPAWPRFLLHEHPEIELLTYLDADLFFFFDPGVVIEALGFKSILIVPHRFSPALRDREKYGIYNVGLVSFRNDPIGHACLDWWRARCLEWCFDRVEGGRFADQKYLDDWPQRFSRVTVLHDTAAGLAPWNVGRYALRHARGRFSVEGRPLVFYHFHGLRRLNRWMYDPGLGDYGVRLTPDLRALYARYVHALSATERSLEEKGICAPVGPPALRSGGLIPRSPLLLARGLISGRFGVADWRAMDHRLREGSTRGGAAEHAAPRAPRECEKSGLGPGGTDESGERATRGGD